MLACEVSSHAQALRRGDDIVYPLTDEPWGVRRFFVRDPNGKLYKRKLREPYWVGRTRNI